MRKDAIIDISGKYRYSLTRIWDTDNPKKVLFIMLNPSTANHEVDDRTTAKCIKFAKRWNSGSLEIVNLFAYRSRKYDELKKLTKEEAIGEENEHYLIKALSTSSMVVAAWGENCRIHNRNNYEELEKIFGKDTLYCLGTTRDGYPRHPLFVKEDKELEVYPLFKNKILG